MSHIKNTFYTYQHITLDTQVVFYVGKGNCTFSYGYGRAYNKSTRSNLWKSIVEKHGYTVEIIEKNLTESEAFSQEKELVNAFGRRDIEAGTLCNFTNGGEGVSGRIMSKKEIDRRTAKSKEVALRPGWIEKMKKINSAQARKRYSRKFVVYKAISIRKKSPGISAEYVKGDFVGYWTHKDICAKDLGIYWTGISQALCQRVKQYKQYIFEYVE